MWVTWWFWLSAALILGILEVLVPGYIFLGFAIAALIVTLLTFVGLPSLGLPLLLVVFAALSLGAYLGLRYFFKLERGQVKTWDRDIND